jgi:hypothetical protein
MSKDQANKVLYIKFYKYIGCMSVRKFPIKIVIYYIKMIINIVIMGIWYAVKLCIKEPVNFDFRLKWFFNLYI